jgi:hypothetical protein
MGSIYQYYNTDDDSDGTGSTSGYWLAQTFTTVTAYAITSVKLKLRKHTTNAPGTVTVSIKAVDGANKPTGADLISGTTDGDAITSVAGGEWITITFDSVYNLSAATQYAIVVRPAGAAISLYWRVDVTGATYAGGDRLTSADGGSSWNITGGNDQMFETWGNFPAPSDKVFSQQLIAIGGDEVWYESAAGTMTELAAANGDINNLNPLTAVEAFQKLFIANETNLKVIDLSNVKITTADILPAGKVIPLKGDVLTGGTSTASMIVDYIDATDGACNVYGYRTTSNTFQDAEVVTGTNTNGDISFTTNAAETTAPHWYDWTAYSNDTTNYGTMPSSAYIIARYRGRLILSGHPSYPHQWYMSESADPWDWLYSTNDPMTAVAGQNAVAGEVGDIVRALVPYGDDYMVIGCASSIFLLTGDPAIGGSLDEISETVGIYGPWAWCKDANGNLYFFSSDGGLYKMKGGREKPANLSVGALPKLVDDWAVLPASHRIVLSYDPKRDGIIISRTTLSGGTNLNYWYSLRTGGFYPETYPEECAIFSSCIYNSDASGNRGLLLGTNDGYIKYFKDTAKDDDIGDSDEAISSYFTVAPFPVGDGVEVEGKIKQIVFECAGGASSGDFSDTDGFSYDVHVADDAETCIEDVIDAATANLTGTISGTGRKTRIRQNVRGQYATIKLYNSTAAETFAINRIMIDKKTVGRLKD